MKRLMAAYRAWRRGLALRNRVDWMTREEFARVRWCQAIYTARSRNTTNTYEGRIQP